MSVRVSYRNSPSRLWNSVDVSLLETDLIKSGVADFSGDGSDCQVVENDTPDNQVKVKVGRVYISGIDDGLEDPHSERIYVTEEELLTVPANSSGDDRVDAVIARVQAGVVPDAEADNNGTIELIEGTGTSALSDAAIIAELDSGDGFYRLADIITPDSFSTITNSDIVDTRQPSKINIQALQSVYSGELGYVGSATGSSDTFNVTLPYPILEITEGLRFSFKSNQTVTGAVGIIVTDSRGVAFASVDLRKNKDGTISPGDIEEDMVIDVQFDGTNFQMQTPQIPEQGDLENLFLWGTGSDGNETLTGNDSITSDAHYETLDLAGFNLTTGGYRVFARRITDSSGGGGIFAPGGGNGGNGGNAAPVGGTPGGSGGSAGAASSGVTLPDSTAGKTGGSGGSGKSGEPVANGNPGSAGTAGTSVTNSIGSTSGSAGGSGGAGGSGSAGPAGNGAPGGSAGPAGTATDGSISKKYIVDLPRMITSKGETLSEIKGNGGSGSGGGGGGGGNAGTPPVGSNGGGGGGGGGSGGEGGRWFVSAKVMDGNWDIVSTGGLGGDGGNGTYGSGAPADTGGSGGGGGGGAGGSGGSGINIYSDNSGWTGSYVLTGAAGGAAGSAGAPDGGGALGVDGSPGNSGSNGIALEIEV